MKNFSNFLADNSIGGAYEFKTNSVVEIYNNNFF